MRLLGCLLKTTLLTVVVLSSMCAYALAQTTIKGKVTDRSTGESLPLANVIMTNLDDGNTFGQATTLDGVFEIKVNDAGNYTFEISYSGYKPYSESIEITGSGTITKNIALEAGVTLNPVIVSASKRKEKITEAPAAIEVIEAAKLQNTSSVSNAELVKSAKGVDVAQQGIASQTITTRGFNNIFSATLLILTDNRIARVPSLRANVAHMMTISNEDVEQVEMVLGPGSALYGPNVNSGVMHFITKSPLTSQGTRVTVSGGSNAFQKLQFRTAQKVTDKLGVKFSAQYVTAEDFELNEGAWTDESLVAELARAGGQRQNFNIEGTDDYRLNELYNRALWLSNPDRNQAQKNIGIRDYDVEKFAANGRVDYQFNPDTRLSFNGGFNSASNVELTGLGAGVAKNWQQYFGQIRFTHKDFFAQAYINGSNSGDTYIAATGNPITDKSSLAVAQVQHFTQLDKFKFTYGLDYLITTPQTEGTVNGRYDSRDQTSEVGGYFQAEYPLTNHIDLVGSFRVDKHSELEDPVFSPRAGIVFKPHPSHTFRATYNKSFSTPSSNALWLDISANSISLPFGLSYDVRAQGVPSSGFNFERDANGFPKFYSGLAPGAAFNLDATNAQTWSMLSTLIQGGLQQGVTGALMQAGYDQATATQQATQLIGALQQNGVFSNPQDIALHLAYLNTSTSQFEPMNNPSDIQDIAAMKPTIYNTFEVGYKGLIENKLLVTADVYYTKAYDFVGPLIIETPNVFIDRTGVTSYMTNVLLASGQFDQATAQAIASAVASGTPQAPGGLADLPFGVVTPSGQFDRDAIMLTYRNFGEIDYFGVDLGLEYMVNNNLQFLANYSFISDDKWLDLDNNEDLDIYLNAPQNKFMVATAYNNNGWNGELRYRFIEGFPIESGIYVTDLKDPSNPNSEREAIDSYSVVDLNVGYSFKEISGLRVFANISNLFDKQNRQFAGTPAIGRVAIFGASYGF